MTADDFARRSFVYRRKEAINIAVGRHFNPTKLRLFDLSVFPRWGLKGRDAMAWLERAGVKIPIQDNTAEIQSDDSVVARLSPSEVLVLGAFRGECAIGKKITRLSVSGSDACYPVPRRDSHCWFAVTGNDAPIMFAKLCAVDLSPSQFAIGQVAQTSVARLSAILIRHNRRDSLGYSILSDSASAEYLWDCILDAMTEFSGIVSGIDELELNPRQGDSQ
jgi:sarcosine oxidase subunit gamma